jgi:cytochrome b561
VSWGASVALRNMDPRQQAALALGSFLLVADLLVLLVSGDFNVALGGAGVSIFGLAFTLPRNGKHNGNGGP